MAGSPVFERFVRSVQGKAVARYGTDGLIGAERVALTEEQRRAHACPIVWDTERIVALTAEYCGRYRREINASVRRGELIEVKREAWEAQANAQPNTQRSVTTEGTTETTAAEAPQAKRARRGKEDSQ